MHQLKLLNRGAKLTELLKQNQYSPLTVAEQVITIFAGVKGYLDDVEIKDIGKFELTLLEKIKNDNSEIIDSISKEGKLDEDTENKLSTIIVNLKKKV